MLGTSFPRWAGLPANAAADGPSATAPDVGEAVSWMTTNGPLLTFDLVRPASDGDAADPRADQA